MRAARPRPRSRRERERALCSRTAPRVAAEKDETRDGVKEEREQQDEEEEEEK